MIGKAGAMLKRIGIAARQDIEQMSESRVMLTLNVATRENWTESDRELDRLLG